MLFLINAGLGFTCLLEIYAGKQIEDYTKFRMKMVWANLLEVNQEEVNLTIYPSMLFRDGKEEMNKNHCLFM